MLVAAGLLWSWPGHAAPKVDIEPFVVDSDITDAKISPGGEYLALSVPKDGQTGLVIITRGDRKVATSMRFPKDTHVSGFWWVNDTRVVVSIAETFGTRDDPVPTGELYGVDADGKRKELLVGWRVRGTEFGSRIRPQNKEELVAAFLVDPLPDDDDHVLVSVRPFSKDPFVRVEKMNVYTGRRVRTATVPVTHADFVTDNRGQVRFAVGAMSDNSSQLFYRDSDAADWKRINYEAESGRIEIPLGFSRDDGTAYLRVSSARGPDAIVALDIATGERSELMRDDVVDPVPIYQDGWGRPLGARFLGAKPMMRFFDDADTDARLYRSLEKAFPDTVVEIPSATGDGRVKVVLSTSDIDPGSFYLFDTVTKKADFIFARSKLVDPPEMSPMKPVSLRARDGLDLHGFLTLPAGADGRPSPLVVLPHGGPYRVYDSWSFDKDVQLLARAGYAVLQVNFRGSGNYGRAFRLAGAREWGGTMQDDLTDATRWAIQEGIADPDRICLYGASYGGYASLMGVAKEPDLYRCAVGYVGVYDLRMMQREDMRVSAGMRTWTREWVGNDAAALAAASPTTLAHRIKVPVFLAAGGEDKVAPIAHSEAMERALKRAGVAVETLYYPKEGHGFYTVEHRREFYSRLLDFLDRQIGSRRAVAGE